MMHNVLKLPSVGVPGEIVEPLSKEDEGLLACCPKCHQVAGAGSDGGVKLDHF